MKIVKTRKGHTCDNPNCLANIPKGSQAKTIKEKFWSSWENRNYWTTSYFHIDCDPVTSPNLTNNKLSKYALKEIREDKERNKKKKSS